MDAASEPEGLEASDDAAAAGPDSAGRSLDARLVRRLLAVLGNPPIEFELAWTRERIAGPGSAVAKLRIANRSTLIGILSDPRLRFGDAYSAGQVEIEGDLVQLLEIIYRSAPTGAHSGALARVLNNWRHRPRRNTLIGSRNNIHRHYDLGNEFYSLWLGETMAYTCAYYPTADATLDEAQVAKMDHVCRKLQLTAGDSVVEAGCGWGTLALHMASRFGARVRAFNISKEQIAFARARAREQGLEGRVEFVEDDYRNISGRYDVFVSVGMLEHVGVENYPELGRIARRAIGGEGRGLIHSIGRNHPEPLHPWVERRIFPGAYPPSLSEMMQIFEPSRLSVLDVENIRLHYALTLRAWLALYERAVDKVHAMFDDVFVRMWRLYLAGSIAGFETGTLQLFQVLFTGEENNRIPLTREFMYPH
ncbi:MAG TPA: cyclopropane-fatty-acyl-phospholipid synthase family protein [Steroidobacteraceae bacterium]|jgi:cyclopropane-fatty-acyl-phospholipid synthase|nr:cyclopropane-fatty-acyl-phospholipid synthase family protein [Steroidobacteraceae bacterium]